MRVVSRELTLYKFSELSDSAKSRVISTYFGQPEDYAESVLEDAVRMGGMLGIDFDTRPVKLIGGGTRHDPKIWYSGFCSQGDGASFEGTYCYKKGAVKAIKAECNDEELIRIATALQDVQKKHFYKLRATMTRGPGSNFYSHSNTMSVDVNHYDDEYRDIGEDDEEEVRQLMRDFADWIYGNLKSEYEYCTSEEYVSELCEINNHEFDVNGVMQS